MKHSVLTLIFLINFSLFSVAHAQYQSDLNTSISPQNPGPNEQVTVSVQSYSTDLNAATITWTLNGKSLKSGVGQTSATFTTGNAGAISTVTITARTREGQTYGTTVQINPASVDLIWQSESITPPFYKGKAMYSHQNMITFVAVPHLVSGGREVGAKNLVYKWKSNGVVMESSSGYGKNTLTMTGSVISRPLNVEVEVTSPTSSGSAYARTTVTPSEPGIVLYEKHPLYGIRLQKAMKGTVEINGPEIAVIGVPLFFGTTNQNAANMSYKWSINGTPLNNDVWENVQVFRPREGASGKAKVSLVVENKSKMLQYSSYNFDIMFNNTTTSNNPSL